MVAIALLNETIRSSAYRERRVLGHEAERLEDCAQGLTHVIRLAPHVYPVRSYMPFFREYMPEIACVIPGETQVLVVNPERDAAALACREAAQPVLGAVHETIRFPGPAYRTIPKSPLALYQLRSESKVTLPLVKETDGQPPVLCVETWAGCAILSKEWIRLGFIGKAYENKLDGQYLPDSDLLRPDVQNNLADDVENGRVFHAHVAVSCTTWTQLRALGGKTPVSRTRELPQGDGTIPAEVAGNQEMAVALWYILRCIRKGLFFCLEHPIASRMWRLALVQWLLSTFESMFCIDLDQCAWVKRPGDWEPQDGSADKEGHASSHE